jgi:chemotaxis protein histidine kinase CheA
VEVESTPGKGSKFTLSLPLATATQQSANDAA